MKKSLAPSQRNLIPVKRPFVPLLASNDDPTSDTAPGTSRAFKIVWRKKQFKKHKTWDGDGFIVISSSGVRMLDDMGVELFSTKKAVELKVGQELGLGGKDIEVTEELEWDQFMTLKYFESIKEDMAPAVVQIAKSKPSSFAKGPSRTNLVARHDAHKSDSLVMPRPQHVNTLTQIIDVVIDPIISKHLRPHQRLGVSFLYKCIMGFNESGNGAILADDMGLGKTLQTIALIWTLMSSP